MGPEPDSTPQAAAAPGPGATLRAAREQRGLGLVEAARALNLDPAVLRGLEEDNYAALGAPVFVKGYLRSYAVSLGLDAAPLIADWQRSDPASARLPDMVRVRERPMVGRPARLRLLPLLGIAVVGLLVFALRDLVPALDGTTPPPAARPLGDGLPVLVMPSAAPPQPAPAPVAPPAPRPAEEAAGQPARAPLASVELPPTVQRIDGSGPSRLVLRFTEASWVEVSDRRGRLLYGEQPAGSRRELRGEPPFQLVLGNAPAVELELDGEPFPLAGQNRRGNVLRLAIGGERGQ